MIRSQVLFTRKRNLREERIAFFLYIYTTMKTLRKILKRIILAGILILLIGFMIPQNLIIPVKGATSKDYHAETFWYYPWGKSITHKGVDIFAKAGTDVLSATSGIVIYDGELGRGGNVIIILGPKWRLHYFAHLKEIHTQKFSIVGQGEVIGEVGNSGNAAGKPAHLHYTLLTAIPYPWLADDARQGWKKMFILNPIGYWERDGKKSGM